MIGLNFNQVKMELNGKGHAPILIASWDINSDYSFKSRLLTQAVQ